MHSVEDIPSDNHLYRRVPEDCYDPSSGKCTEGAFLLREKINEHYLSVDWAEKTNINKSCVNPINKQKFKIAELLVQDPLDLKLSVDHIPTKHNYAHSGISGKDLFDEVLRFIRASELAEKGIMRFP